ncbi:hypothetical protein [Nocardioides sp. 1609]|uniref:hypothetical protein n=1 Tax=Nocardioides sp. 1609 TaxID=2508327 RepID=UPI0010702067|nr:hypothetical protein [Nocardioides sp. 1609]
MAHSSSAGSPLRALVQIVRDWPVSSQQRARRNAMVATTSCAQRRVERQEVADFLATRPADHTDHTDRTDPEHRAGH